MGRNWRLDHALHKVGASSLYVLRSFRAPSPKGRPTPPQLPAYLRRFSISPLHRARSPRLRPSLRLRRRHLGASRDRLEGVARALGAGSYPAKSRSPRWAEIGRGVRKLRLLIGSEEGAGARGPASGSPGSSFACNLSAGPLLGQPGGNLRRCGLRPVAARLLLRAAGVVERW